MIIQCPYCSPGTAGDHELDCPNHPRFYVAPYPMAMGWKCPECGAIMAPLQPSCIYCAPPARVTCNAVVLGTYERPKLEFPPEYYEESGNE